MSTLSERILDLSKDLERGWQAALARHCKINPVSVANWVSGKSKSLEGANLLKAAEFFQVNPSWLATGKGHKTAIQRDNSVLTVRADDPAVGGYVRLQHLSIEGSCGFGRVNCWPEEVGQLDVSEAWLQNSIRVPHNSVRIINARGDSMRPNIKDGDLIFVDIATDRFVGSGVYVIVWMNDPDGLCAIKRIERLPNGKLRIFQDNKDVGYTTDHETDGSDIRIVGKVAAAWQLAVF